MSSSPDVGIIPRALFAVTGRGMEAFRTYSALDFPNLILPSENGIFYHITMLIIGLVLVKSDLGPSKFMLIAKKPYSLKGTHQGSIPQLAAM